MRVPIELHEKLKKELDEMENRHVIRKVNTPKDWVNWFGKRKVMDGWGSAWIPMT